MTEKSNAHILILCEKSLQARAILSAAVEAMPGKRIICFSLTTGIGHSSSGETVGTKTVLMSPSGLMLKLPSKLPIGQVPMIVEPVYLPTVSQNFDVLGKLMDEAESIVFSCDVDARGVYMFAQHVRKRFGTCEGFPALKVCQHNIKHIVEEFSAGRTTSDEWFLDLLAEAEAKRFFDANWAANALPLFGKLLKDCGANDPGIFVSKYLVQVLFLLQKAGSFTEQVAVSVMMKNSGSGKYRSYGIGSPTSRYEILKTAIDIGLIEPFIGSKSSSLTPLGEEFMRRLHPDCEDPDLSVRIGKWGASWPESRPQIERYIRTWFGKQNRHMSKFEEVVPCRP